ncbi:hypothetical protein [Gracilimonas sp.]|uniref:hypothetical protein n=1 Tax=Gracilimonas sp. TaxID=1974203 RepID=UPI003D0DFF6E
MLKNTPLKHLLLILLVVSSYFLILRPTRAFLNGHIFVPVVEKNLESDQYYFTSSVGTRLLSENEWNGTQLKFPFGLFFLFVFLGLALVKADRKFFVFLISLHLVGGIISYVSLWLGIIFNDTFFLLPDLFSRYLIPILSFALIPLSMGFAKKRD